MARVLAHTMGHESQNVWWCSSARVLRVFVDVPGRLLIWVKVLFKKKIFQVSHSCWTKQLTTHHIDERHTDYNNQCDYPDGILAASLKLT